MGQEQEIERLKQLVKVYDSYLKDMLFELNTREDAWYWNTYRRLHDLAKELGAID